MPRSPPFIFVKTSEKQIGLNIFYLAFPLYTENKQRTAQLRLMDGIEVAKCQERSNK